jgi:hypothetical protein
MTVPLPARASRLGALRSELGLAAGYGDSQRAAELQAQIDWLSAAGSAVNPATETAARRKPPGRPSRRSSGVAADR